MVETISFHRRIFDRYLRRGVVNKSHRKRIEFYLKKKKKKKKKRMKLQEKCVYVQNIAGYEDGDDDFFLEICCKLYTPTEVCLFLTLTVTKQC